jgi:hypothetical protein
MKGYYQQKTTESNEGLFVPSNFYVYRDGQRTIFISGPNELEELNLQMMAQRNEIGKDIEGGIVKIVELETSCLKEISELIWKEDSHGAYCKIIELLNIVRSTYSTNSTWE